MKNADSIRSGGLIIMVIFTAASLPPLQAEGAGFLTAAAGTAAYLMCRSGTGAERPPSELGRGMMLLILMPVMMNMICFLSAHFLMPAAADHIAARTGNITAGMLPFYVLMIAAASVLEELAWRGFFQKETGRRIGDVPALVLASVLFTLCHFTPGDTAAVAFDLIFVFINTVFYGTVFIKSGSAALSIMSHFLADMTGIAMAVFT